MKKLLLIILVILQVQACAHAEPDTLAVDSLAMARAPWQIDTLDGFVVKQYAFDQGQIFGANQVVSIIEIPKKSACRLAFAHDTVLTMTSELAQRHHAKAAVNGTYFDMDLGNPICYLRINGDTVGENTPGKNDSVNRKYYQYATTVLYKGRPRFLIPDSNRFWEASLPDSNIMTAGPLLIHHNKPLPMRDDRTFVTKRHNRTALALKMDGTILLLTVDGRFKESEGLSLPELIRMLQWLNCREAINLDGGGSTTMYVQGAPYDGVINYPSDNRTFDHQGQRPVSNIVYIK